MLFLSLFTQPFIDELEEKFALDLNIWYADDGTLTGQIPAFVKAIAILKESGIALGYHLEVTKFKLW